MEQAKLKALVDQRKSIAEIADIFGKSKGTVRHWLKKYSLKTSGKAGGKRKTTVIDGKKKCSKCGENKPVVQFHSRKDRPGTLQPFCKQCGAKAVSNREKRIKLACIKYKGGKCESCGIESDDSNTGIFEFHHAEPEHKDFSISSAKGKSIQHLTTELDKCQLLCANCHVKRHREMVNESGYKNKIAGNSERFLEVRHVKLEIATDEKFACQECGYNDCPSALIIKFQNDDRKKYVKYNKSVENWSEDYIRALKDAKVVCKNCYRK